MEIREPKSIGNVLFSATIDAVLKSRGHSQQLHEILRNPDKKNPFSIDEILQDLVC